MSNPPTTENILALAQQAARNSGYDRVRMFVARPSCVQSSRSNNRGWNEGFGMDVDAFSRSTIVKAKGKHDGFYALLEEKDQMCQSVGTRFQTYHADMVAVYKQVLKKQERVQNMSVAAAAILAWVKRDTKVNENFIFGLDKKQVASKERFLKKLVEMRASGALTIPRQLGGDNAPSKQAERVKEILSQGGAKDIAAHAKALSRAFDRFSSEAPWLKRITGVTPMKLPVFLAFAATSLRERDSKHVVIGFKHYLTGVIPKGGKAKALVQQFILHATPIELDL